jgi:serine/threonine-protein kinase
MRISLAPSTVGNGALAVAEPAPEHEDLPPGSACGEYVIERKIGEGGMGAVYGARHPVIGKRAAIKVIKRDLSASREGVDRFVREAQAVNTIGHPNIVDVFGFGTLPDGRSFFVMEWLEGEALRDRMTRPLAFGQALEVLESIATALRAAHEAGVVHRDLKPDNVYLARAKGSPAPRVKLLDFGLAKLSGTSGEARVDHTRTGIVMGTPLYLSPEQAKGVKIDFATDVYSLGVIAYEMAAGAVPFTAESAVEIMAAHISTPAAPLHDYAPWVPPAFEQLVHRMLAKEPRARPPIAEVEQELATMRAQPDIANAAPVPGGGATQWTPVPVQSMPQITPRGAVTPPPMLAPRRSRRGLVIGIVAGVVVAGGVIGVLAFGKSATHDDVVAIAPIAAVKPEPAKPEPAKPEPAGTETTEPADTVKTEPLNAELVKTESPKLPATKRPVAKLGTLALTITGAANSNVLVDGKVVASDVATISLELAPGEHRLRVQAAGRKTVERVIRIESGANKPLSVQLRPKSFDTIHDPFSE